MQGGQAGGRKSSLAGSEPVQTLSHISGREVQEIKTTGVPPLVLSVLLLSVLELLPSGRDLYFPEWWL